MRPIAALRFPPVDVTSCIAIVCNGEMEFDSHLTHRIKSCLAVIGVDGGLNHCDRMNIQPNWIIGDLDSVSPAILEKMEGPKTRLKRAKDETDLEVAIAKAREIAASSPIIIFGGLGGRMDHTLTNLLLLFRDPSLLIESQDQCFFALHASSGKIEIDHSQFHTLLFFPLYGEAKNLLIETPEGVHEILVLNKQTAPAVFTISHKSWISIGEGEALVCLMRNVEIEFQNLAKERSPPLFPTVNKIDYPFIYNLDLLRQVSNLNDCHAQVVTSLESIVVLNPSSNEVLFPSCRGQTVSLIPFYGPAEGLVSQGLKWELGGAVNSLNKDFIGISNVSMGDLFKVKVGKGELLCVKNTHHIDHEMVQAEIQ